MEMPQTLKFDTRDFTPPHSLKDALQRFSLELDCLLVWLRNEARYHDNRDHAVLDVACHAAHVLEDSYKETEALIRELEKRVSGADLS